MTVRVRPTDTVSVHPPTISWEDIQVGDHIDAGGETDDSGDVVVPSIDVNVAQVWGTIVEVTADGAWLISPESRHTEASIPRDNEGRVRVVFDPAIPLMDRQNQPLTLQALMSVKPGTEVEVVGMRAPSASAVTAETLIGTLPPDAFGP